MSSSTFIDPKRIELLMQRLNVTSSASTPSKPKKTATKNLLLVKKK